MFHFIISLYNTSVYYVNTSEIPSELSRENFISSHVKRSPSLWLHNKSRLFHRSLSGVYIINRILHVTREISSWTLEDKIHIHVRSCNMLYIFCNDLGSFQGGWISQYADTNQFLQINLGKVTKVTRIATQGRYDAGWWSKTYTLAYSVDGGTFMLYNNGQVRDFSDPVTVKPAPYQEDHISSRYPLLTGYQLDSLTFLPKFTVK